MSNRTGPPKSKGSATPRFEKPKLGLPASVELIEAEFKGSDRAAAIVSAALLDARLEFILRSYLAPSSDRKDRLFDGPDAVLSTFSSRILMVFRLGVISDFEREKLDFVRDIRNQFAHSFEPLDFNNPSIADKCRHHQLPIECIGLPMEFRREFGDEQRSQVLLAKATKDDPRGMFKEVVIYLMDALLMMHATTRKSLRPPARTQSWRDIIDVTILEWKQTLGDIEKFLENPGLSAEDRGPIESNQQWFYLVIARFERVKELHRLAVEAWKNAHPGG